VCGVIVRIWRTEVQDGRLSEYREFARHRSLPMFRQQPGFRGVVLAAGPKEHVVITFWDTAADVARLDSSPSYHDTADALLASGILRGTQRVEVFEGEIGFLDLT
jgi:heme-degrading monooxygenase HmoA